MPDWESLIPPVRGRLPSGEAVHRTEPNGPLDAPIVVLGVYPAARVSMATVQGVRMNLPVEVERRSFDVVSASGHEIDARYLGPLGLSRDDVLLVDLLPYFLANVRGSKGRTMWDNLRRFERSAGVSLRIEPRPPPAALVEQAQSMPGNVERLRYYIGAAERRVLLTLGVEAAAFARGESYRRTRARARDTFYAEPVRELGVFDLPMVHLAHPGILISAPSRAAFWHQRHAAWCGGAGRHPAPPRTPRRRPGARARPLPHRGSRVAQPGREGVPGFPIGHGAQRRGSVPNMAPTPLMPLAH